MQLITSLNYLNMQTHQCLTIRQEIFVYLIFSKNQILPQDL